MNSVKVPIKDGKTAIIIEASEEEVLEHTTGACLACGAEADGVEPDARRYTCESCGEPRVYGLEELVLMGRLRLVMRTKRNRDMEASDG